MQAAAAVLALVIGALGACSKDDSDGGSSGTPSSLEDGSLGTTVPSIDESEIDASWLQDTGGAEVGEIVTVDCEPEGGLVTVWGTETYTDDSSICTAAVHAGLITVADGGEVSVEVVEGLDAWEGSTANGVETLDYGPWPKGFVFVEE